MLSNIIDEYSNFEQTQDDIVLAQNIEDKTIMWTTIDELDPDNPDGANVDESWTKLFMLTDVPTKEDLIKKLDEIGVK